MYEPHNHVSAGSEHPQISFLREAANYFRNRPTHGEDRAFWSNVANADNCEKAANLIERMLDAAQPAGDTQVDVLATMQETEEADIDFLLKGLGLDPAFSRDYVKSFRKQTIQVAVSLASQPSPAATVETNQFETTKAGVIDWKIEAERANRLLAQAERPKCRLCDLEDGACICAHLPPRLSAANGGALHDVRVLLQAIYDLIDDEDAAEPLDYAIAHAKKALAILDTTNEPQAVATPAFDALAAEVIDRISERYNKLAASPLGMATVWERKASGGKPLLYGGKRGLLASGTIATWDEFDLIADVINNLPTLLAACSVTRPQSRSGE